MTYRLIVGIDPSLSATGVAVLEHVGNAWKLVYRRTVGAPPKGSLVDRIDSLARDFRTALREAITGRPGPALVVAEDPSDFRVPQSGPSQMIRFGAGIAAVLLEAKRICADHGLPFETYGVNEWMPRQGGRRGGGWVYHVPHKQLLAQTRMLIPGTVEATDDECMAAALALTRAVRA